MSTTTVASSQGPALSEEGAVKRFLRATEIDTRMLGMVGALLIIWLGFHFYGRFVNGNGVFLTSRNLWNLLVQSSSIMVMTTGMVLIIVTRQIDLSVGSILGFTAVCIGTMQVYWLGPALGIGHPAIWIVTLLIGIGIGAAIGCFHGALIAYAGIPSFIVTLGGLLVWRGAAWWVIRGETVAPMDVTFKLIGGGPFGAIGPMWSWIVGLVACAGIIAAVLSGRRQRQRFHFPVRPIWAEAFIAALGCVVTLATVLVVNSYAWAPKVIEKYATDNDIPIPEGVLDADGSAICRSGEQVVRCTSGLIYNHGFAIPVLIALAVGFGMTFLATRTRFGRYVYATGGNPEAAELAGINTKKITLLIFTLMGGLCAISASISSARLNSATNALGQFDELYVIAAAVIGGTSLAGGTGTIYGAMLGALVMQSLQSGMVLLNFDAAVQQMVVGAVLVFAVFIDTVYGKRVK